MLYSLAFAALFSSASALITGFTLDFESLIAFDVENPINAISIPLKLRMDTIDFHAPTKQLFGTSGRDVYIINPCNGKLTLHAEDVLPFRAEEADFNPTNNKLRTVELVETAAYELGTGSVPGVGAFVFEETGLPALVYGIAYTNNDDDPETGTTLFALVEENRPEEATEPGLARVPQSYTLHPCQIDGDDVIVQKAIGRINAAFDEDVGFDIFFNENSKTRKNRAFVMTGDRLFEIDLTTGLVRDGVLIGQKEFLSSSSSSSSSTSSREKELSVFSDITLYKGLAIFGETGCHLHESPAAAASSSSSSTD